MSENLLYIQITHDFTQGGTSYYYRQQFVYIGYEYKSTEYDSCDEQCIELHYIGLDCNDNEIYIPAKFSVLTKECIATEDISIPEYIKNRDTDKFDDYYKMVIPFKFAGF